MSSGQNCHVTKLSQKMSCWQTCHVTKLSREKKLSRGQKLSKEKKSSGQKLSKEQKCPVDRNCQQIVKWTEIYCIKKLSKEQPKLTWVVKISAQISQIVCSKLT